VSGYGDLFDENVWDFLTFDPVGGRAGSSLVGA